MLDRAACERRVYRLATLLTGNPLSATGVIGSVVDAQPDLRQLDSAHLDRLTVLRSREVEAARIVDERVDPASAGALAALSAQQREAWVLARLYRCGERETARAMDCSVTAVRLHLAQADRAMGAAGAPPPEAVAQALRDYTLTLDVPEFYRAARRRRARIRLAFRLALAGVAIMGLLALARALQG
jgi:hypothetical protein